MKGRVKIALLVVLCLGLASLSGCALCEKGLKALAEAPKAPTAKMMKETPAPPPALPTQYVVEQCDDLWSIAAKPQLYADPLMWPLLWDANRDQIHDPNKIKPGMKLSVPRDLSQQQQADARGRALAFPRYVAPPGAKRYCPPK